MNRIKNTNELDNIYREMISSRDEQQIAVAFKLLKKYIGKNRNRLLLLEAQLRAWEKNMDMNFHLAIVAVVISVISVVLTVMLEIASWFEQIEVLKITITVAVSIIGLLTIIYPIYILVRVIKHMKRRESYEYICVALEEYKQNFKK